MEIRKFLSISWNIVGMVRSCLVLFGESRRLDLIFHLFNNLCVYIFLLFINKEEGKHADTWTENLWKNSNFIILCMFSSVCYIYIYIYIC